MIIRPVEISDASSLAEIYNHYIRTTVITFEETPLDVQEMAERISENRRNDMPWFAAELTPGTVIGYAYASRWKGRCAYRYSVEVTVYVSAAHARKGAGRALYEALFEALKTRGFHVVIAGISLPNPASIKLHEAFGMTKTAHFKEVGYKFGDWVDVGYWQGFLDEASRG